MRQTGRPAARDSGVPHGISPGDRLVADGGGEMTFAHARRAMKQPITLRGDKLAGGHLQHQTLIQCWHGGEVELRPAF